MRGERNLPVTVWPPLGKGAKGTGEADCHSQCAHWLRNDTLYEMRYESVGATARVAPTERNKKCHGRADVGIGPYEWVVGVDDPVRPVPITQHLVGQGPCALPGVREKSGSGRRERWPQRKCILWCVGEGLCPSVGATARVAPTEGLQEVRGERNPPVTASPCQPPLGKGAGEDGRKQRAF